MSTTPPAPLAVEALPVVGYAIRESDQFMWAPTDGRPFASKWRAVVYASDAEAQLSTLRDQVARLERERDQWRDEYRFMQAQASKALTRPIRTHGALPPPGAQTTPLPPFGPHPATQMRGGDPLDVEHASDLVALRLFAGEVMGDWPDVGGLDGFDMQAIGEKTGLLRRETRQAPCSEQCACVEFDSGEVECWRVEPVLQRAREALRSALAGDGK